MTATDPQQILPAQVLPAEGAAAVLVGRVWDPASSGPRVVGVRGDEVFDLTHKARTVAGLLEQENPADYVLHSAGPPRWNLADLIEASLAGDRAAAPSAVPD